MIGPDAPLMVDANQAFEYSEALRRGRVYEELDCRWFEEPLPAADTDGHVRLTEKLDIPIATGENRYGQAAFRDLIDRGGARCRPAGPAASRWAHRLPGDRADGGRVRCAVRIARRWCAHPRAGRPAEHDLVQSGLLPADGRVELGDGCYPLPLGPGLSSWSD